ncbi:MAG: hypothetical protein HQL71_07725 [Magnetococcales bacterium]|nr:hypothetical protein [Magnetococcales bacterium]
MINIGQYNQRLATIALVTVLFFLGIAPQDDPLTMPQLAHLILAVGAFPLIIGAMIYFTPTLTRSAPPTGWICWLPYLAMFTGFIAFSAVSQDMQFIVVSGPMGIVLSGGLLYWMWQRSSNALGDPHPGLAWYQGALFFLILGLSTIILAYLLPQWWFPLRGVHQQLNLMGFLGLTTVGTLQVFLPTVANYQDNKTSYRLKNHLKYSALGTLFLAAGGWGLPFCNEMGRLVWLVPLLAIFKSAMLHVDKQKGLSGAAFSLFGALTGFTVLIIFNQYSNLYYLFCFFVFPLVTGALSHLLPIWWWPGAASNNRDLAQAFLARWGFFRLGAFYVAGLATIWNVKWGGWLAGITILFFAIQIMFARRHY